MGGSLSEEREVRLFVATDDSQFNLDTGDASALSKDCSLWANLLRD